MQHQDTLIGKLSVSISLTFAYISVTNVQPYLTAMASIVSIIAGCFAINYYVKKSK